MLKAYLLIIFLFKPLIFIQKSPPDLIILSSQESRKTNRFDEDGMKLLSDDKISYLLSDLSMYDVNTLSQLIDVMNEQGIEIENDIEDRETFDQLTRFNSETRTDVPTGENQNHPVANVNEKYIRQLDDSFPNVDQLDQDDQEKEHIRVKRD